MNIFFALILLNLNLAYSYPRFGLADRASLTHGGNSYLDVVNISGLGRLRGANISIGAGSCGANAAIRITVNGSSVQTISITGLSGVDRKLKANSGSSASKFQLTSGADDPSQNLNIFYKNSLRVEFNGDSCGGGTQVIVDYERN